MPAISYDCLTGPSDLIIPGVNGVLVPPNDQAGLTRALAELMDGTALRERMRDASAPLRTAHAPEHIAAQWIDAFKALGAGA